MLRGQKNQLLVCIQDFDANLDYTLIVGCNKTELPLVVQAYCQDNILFEFELDCNLDKGHYAFDIQQDSNIVFSDTLYLN